jgi:CheY-like chemotaxis protein
MFFIVQAHERGRNMQRVMVVDDDPALREMLAIILEGEEFDVATAGDGRAAVERIAKGWHPDIILLDLMMPVMDGAAVCRWLVTHMPPHERPRVVILSASALPGEVVPEADAMLPKPFSIDAVLGLLHRMCPPQLPAIA